ncbi:transcription elongation factor GreA, partial [Salmonella enterica subsp. enterica serovar Istanbul]|nr:transcription elongation factor GreA [Salmonella enterica subsp. enterica serovar Istanbul]
AEAAALGDRSENAEYSAAKRELRQLEGRLRYLDKLIRYAKVTTPAAANLADIGNWVTLKFDDDQDEDTYE